MAGVLFQWQYDYPYASEVNYRLYEAGQTDPIVDNIAEPNFSLTMDGKAYGDYSYHVTAVRNGLESPPSNTVTVNFTLPEAPMNLQFGWVG